MREQVIALKAAMETVERYDEEVKELRVAFEEQYSVLFENQKSARASVEEIRDVIKPLAIDAFSESGDKQMFGGIGIRESKAKTVYVYDPADALAFAKDKDMFLSLDKKSFEAAIPGITVDFVEVKTEPGAVTVTFPKEIKIDE